MDMWITCGRHRIEQLSFPGEPQGLEFKLLLKEEPPEHTGHYLLSMFHRFSHLILTIALHNKCFSFSLFYSGETETAKG